MSSSPRLIIYIIFHGTKGTIKISVGLTTKAGGAGSFHKRLLLDSCSVSVVVIQQLLYGMFGLAGTGG